jgi:transcriptional regulator with XRE-family HTH domain
MRTQTKTKKRAAADAIRSEPGFREAKPRANLTPGQMLKTIRELQEMTQVQLAEASGIDQSVISAMEHGRVAIGADRARKLARALRVHPAVILFPDWSTEDDAGAQPEPKRAAGGGR